MLSGGVTLLLAAFEKKKHLCKLSKAVCMSHEMIHVTSITT